MRSTKPWSVALSTLVLSAAASASSAAESPAAIPQLTLNVSHVTGAETVTASGTSLRGRTLEATLYATFSRDLPDAVLGRRIINVDANGNYTATLSTAPAYFRDAVVTVVVRSTLDGTAARARVRVIAPNVESSSDLTPR